MKLVLSTHSPERLVPRRRARRRGGGGDWSLLTVIAVVIHQDDFFYQVGRAFLKDTEERQKDTVASLSGVWRGWETLIPWLQSWMEEPSAPLVLQSGDLSAPPDGPCLAALGTGPYSASLLGMPL